MARFRRLRRSIRCHLKHGTRCPHIERHALHRPKRRKKLQVQQAIESTAGAGRHASPGH